jgi:MFS family permease
VVSLVEKAGEAAAGNLVALVRYRDDHEAKRPMTGIDDTEKTAGRSPAQLLSRPLAPYAEIFRIPGAWRFSAAAVIGRMPMSMFGLGTVLLISAGTGKYGAAGAVSAAGSLGYAFSSPRIARFVDTRGQRRVLLPVLVVFALATGALIAAVQARLPTWAFFVPGAIAGAAMPSLGTMVRARWSVLLAGSPQLHVAFSFESVADELCFIIGPAAVTLLATEVFPASGVGVAALLCVAGTLWFIAQRGTEPVIVRPQARLAEPGRPAAPLEPASRVRRRGPGRGAPAPGLIVLAPVYLLLGAMFISVDLSTVAFAQHFGHKPLAGFILGTYAFGSATGGLWYGSRHWRAAVEKRFTLTLVLTVLGVATFWAQPNLITLTCGIYLCGLTIAPTLIAGFSLLEAQARPGRRTEAMSWLSSGIGVGIAVGASAVGFIIDAHGPRAGYAFAAACGVASAATCLTGLRRLRSSKPPAPVPAQA